MREIVVISGKGGTGKTSLAASFAYLEKGNCALGDCDVDAANMYLLLDADFNYQE
ncbi:MAG: (4Fe-4S)-binding protein, partial [Campylobacterota bacterium]|nr:(4Fe-4S)-binding protein [Campylobacterota bacterium]